MAATGQRTIKAAEERRRDILAAAQKLFAEQGFDATTVNDIASASGAAVGTVYLHFASKEHVLLGLHEEFHRGLEEAFIGAVVAVAEERGDGLQRREVINAALDAVVAFCVEHREACRVMTRFAPRSGFDDHADEGFVGVFARALDVGMERGTVAVSDPEIAAMLLYEMLSRSISEAIAAGDDALLERVVAQAKELLDKALMPVPPAA